MALPALSSNLSPHLSLALGYGQISVNTEHLIPRFVKVISLGRSVALGDDRQVTRHLRITTGQDKITEKSDLSVLIINTDILKNTIQSLQTKLQSWYFSAY